MNKLESIIAEKISRKGPLTFRTFMEMALYYPGLGYYCSPDITIGRQGDFYTSSHVHPIFGAMIARTLREMWEIMGRPSTFHAVEIGAGNGYLCRDIFDYMVSDGKMRDFSNAIKYIIIEPYSHFIERQREIIGDYSRHVTWIKSLPDRITGCIFSNELLDAFPVHLIEMGDDLKEIFVDHKDNKFIEILQDISTPKIANYIKDFAINLDRGYRTEINLRIREWLSDVSSSLSRGFVLTIDYGYTSKEYYSEERNRGTLLCYHKHQLNEHPLQNVGTQDITAHINFSSLDKWGKEHGLKTIGYCSQGIYLTAAGIDEVITERYSASPYYLTEICRIKTLIMPQGMGESHMVLVQYRGDGYPEMRGFSIRNNSSLL